MEPMLQRIWALRHNMTAYDAAYVALAEALDAPLVTCDAKLGAAVNDVRVEVIEEHALHEPSEGERAGHTDSRAGQIHAQRVPPHEPKDATLTRAQCRPPRAARSEPISVRSGTRAALNAGPTAQSRPVSSDCAVTLGYPCP